jgi:hypothetical protein
MGEAPQFFDEMDGFDGNVREPYSKHIPTGCRR